MKAAHIQSKSPQMGLKFAVTIARMGLKKNRHGTTEVEHLNCRCYAVPGILTIVFLSTYQLTIWPTSQWAQ